MLLERKLKGLAGDYRREHAPYGDESGHRATVTTPSDGGGWGFSLEADLNPSEVADFRRGKTVGKYKGLRSDPRLGKARRAMKSASEMPSSVFGVPKYLAKKAGDFVRGEDYYYQEGGQVKGDKASGYWGPPGAYNEALEAQRSITELDRTQEEAEEALRLKRLNHEIKSYERDRGIKPFDSYSGEEIQKYMYDIMPYIRSFGRLETPAQKKDAFVYRRLGLDPRKPPFQLQGLQGQALLQGLRNEQQ